jgi:hypothetical protein
MHVISCICLQHNVFICMLLLFSLPCEQWLEDVYTEIMDNFRRSADADATNLRNAVAREQEAAAREQEAADRLEESRRQYHEAKRLHEERKKLKKQGRLLACAACRGVKQGVCPIVTLGMECTGEYNRGQYKKMYTTLALVKHPDKGGTDEEFQPIGDAWEKIQWHLDKGHARRHMWKPIKNDGIL